MMKRLIGGFATLACLAPVACSSTGDSGSYPENVGELGQALSFQPYYLKNQGMYCRVTPASGTAGNPTSRAGLIMCDKATADSTVHSFMKIPSGSNFKFQVATGPDSVGMFVARSGSPSRLNGTMYTGTDFTETNCGNGNFAYQDTTQNMMQLQGDGIATSSTSSCGNAANEWTWVANGSAIPQPATSPTSTNTNAPATYFSTLTTARQWKISLPQDLFGSGTVTDIYENELPNWYHSQYFYADANHWMVFKSPNEGLTTSGSENSRSELREMLRFGNSTITNMADPANNWGIQGNLTGYAFPRIGGKMSATLRVDKVFAGNCATPGTAAWSTIVGQIHANQLPDFDDTSAINRGGYNNSTVRIHYKKFPQHSKGSVYWLYQNNWPKGDSRRVDKCYPVWGTCPGVADTTDPANGIALGEDFSYVVEVAGSTQNVTFTRPAGTPATVTFSMNLASTGIANDNPYGWKYDALYFKAGNYNQSNTSSNGCDGAGLTTAQQYTAGDYAQVTFKSLTVGPSGTSTPVCGNGAVESGETCDDGNTLTETCTYGLTSCTVCNSTCQSVAGATSRCGDSSVQSPEQCDDGNTVNTDACSNSCKTPTCTDGIKNGTETNTDCGGVSGGVTCPACVAAVCGNGVVQSPEQCDDGNTVTEPCAYGLTSCTVCSSTCTNVAGATSRCGDGTKQSNEQCDDGNTVDTDNCRNTCVSATCTDGIKDGTETGVDCGGVSNGVTCAACTASATTYQAENMTLDAGGGGLGTGADAGLVWFEDGAPHTITKTGSVAGSSVTLRYRNDEGTGGAFKLWVNGTSYGPITANSTTAADITFTATVTLNSTVKIETNGAMGLWADYIKINP